MKTSEIVVGQSPNGRDIIVKKISGRFAVQPPNDNYWVDGETIDDAMISAGWATGAGGEIDEVKKERLSHLDRAIDSFTSIAYWSDDPNVGLSIGDVENGDFPFDTPSELLAVAVALHQLRLTLVSE